MIWGLLHMLGDIVLYKELVSRQDEKTKYYSTYIIQIEKNFAPILEYIKAEYPKYPDHGINHSYRIMERISLILSNEFRKELSSLEIVILFFAAFFHDSGMCLLESTDKDEEELRSEHHLAAKKVIDMFFDSGIGGLREKERIKGAVTFVCEAHGLLLEDLVKDRRFHNIDKIDTFTVRYGLLAFLLRIGDLMDLESERANNFRMMMYSENFKKDPLSYDHNLRHQRVLQYYYDPDRLIVRVSADNECQYGIWSDWFGYLSADIEKFNALYARNGLFLPIPETIIEKAWDE